MGIDSDFGRAFAKSQLAANQKLPTAGAVLVSVRDADKEKVVPIVEKLSRMGFLILATGGTSVYLTESGIPNQVVKKIAEGRPHILDHIKNSVIRLVINTASSNSGASCEIRRTVLRYGVPYSTTLSGAWAMVSGIESLSRGGLEVRSIQEYNEGTRELKLTMDKRYLKEKVADQR
jgi:carbamoyl-phosphate synthase large subunit